MCPSGVKGLKYPGDLGEAWLAPAFDEGKVRTDRVLRAHQQLSGAPGPQKWPLLLSSSSWSQSGPRRWEQIS